MKKKGFTLIELLAVIVILAIIALIAIPLIGNVIEKAKIGALENSVNGLIESANMYYANQTIKGEQAVETIFDFANGVQTSDSKLEYKGKVYNGKLILHASGEVAVCIDDKEHYAYKNKDTDEIVSGIGTCLYDGSTGDFSSNSSINDLRGKIVVATNVTQSEDGLSTLISIPEEGHYDETSQISVLNSNLSKVETLWSGEHDYSAFTLDINISKYKIILIEWKYYGGRDSILSGVQVGQKSMISAGDIIDGSQNSKNCQNRTVDLTDTSKIVISQTLGNPDSDYAKIYNIYGI